MSRKRLSPGKLAGDLPAVFLVRSASLFIGELLQEPEPEGKMGIRGVGTAPVRSDGCG